MILPSRKFDNSLVFVDSFLETLTAGIIKRSEFIQWDKIYRNLKKYEMALEFFASLAEQRLDQEKLIAEITNALLSDDEPILHIEGALFLLGHTDSSFVTNEDDFLVSQLAKDISEGKAEVASEFAKSLVDLGFANLLQRDVLDDVLFGIQVGLETHRRKNLGGNNFINLLRPIFLSSLQKAQSQTKKQLVLEEEQTIRFANGLSKKVDFLFKVNDKPRFGIEANFYTTTGSKPTEIKRSYADIKSQLNPIGIDLIWVTDGKGYRRMQKSLADAYEVHANIYNLRQLTHHFANDLIWALNNGA